MRFEHSAFDLFASLKAANASERVSFRVGWAWLRMSSLLSVPLFIAGCASAPLDQAGSLVSYQGLQQANGMFAKSKIRVDKDALLAAKTVRIDPATFAVGARLETVTEDQRTLVANALDRYMCIGLSDRLEVVPFSQPADLTVHAVITHMDATDEKAVAASLGAKIAKSVLLPGIPAPVPRLPVGLGSLSVEAEARGNAGQQVAAMLWGRGANMFMGNARASKSGDAYELASKFADDFSKMIVKGTSPYGSISGLPSAAKFKSLAGGAPKYAACETFGRAPGLAGMVSAAVSAPAEWTDKGGVKVPVASTPVVTQ